MELYKGLPLKTITVNNNDVVECSFGVTTEIVNELIISYFDRDVFKGEIFEFDNSYSYAVPQEIFEDEDEVILKFINENIDDWYQVE